MKHILFTGAFFFFASNVWASLGNPDTDPNFLFLKGKNLKSISVSGTSLFLAKGTGEDFSEAKKAEYERIKNASKSVTGYPAQWALMDLESHVLVDSSAEINRKQFGASTSKVFVAATLVDKQNGILNSEQLQLMANMLVVSSNTAWVELQRQIGDGDSDRGRELNLRFTQRMGYERTRGFQGYLGEMHGNELTPKELVEFLYDTYQDRYEGAEAVWKIMHTLRTGGNRARKYIPATVNIAGKTGTYDGATVDPETGKTTGPDGKPYMVAVRHQIITFRVKGRQYGLAILADTQSDETAALLAGGLYQELSK